MQTSVTAVAADGILRPTVSYFDVLRVHGVVQFVDEVLLVDDYGVLIAELGKPSVTSQRLCDDPGAW